MSTFKLIVFEEHGSGGKKIQGIAEHGHGLEIVGRFNIEESLPDAAQEIRREAVLVAVADAESIEVSDEELESELEHMAEHERTTAAKLLERLKRDGRHEMVAADIRVRKAIDRIAETAEPVAMGAEETKEKLWTPGDPR